MTSIERKKVFEKWQEDLEKRLALYLFNTPELEPTKIIESPWVMRSDGHFEKI